MKVFVGLGNPGNEYEMTRHNAGFHVLDCLAEHWAVSFTSTKFQSLYAEKNVGGEKVILVKPLTYMNNSGHSVAQWMHYYHLQPEDLIVVHDDMDLPVGRIRLRPQGSSGGQKGMGSIIEQLGTTQLQRIRIGVGKHKEINTVDYVLGKFPKDEIPFFEESCKKAAEALEYAVTHPFALTMNHFNV